MGEGFRYMKVALVNAPPLKKYGVTGLMYPPLGILYLISYTKKYLGDIIEYQVFDGYQIDYIELLERIKKFSPDVLGVSFTTQAASGAYTFINAVKKQVPGVKYIIAGGAHPTALPEDVLNSSATDIVVRGKGEITFMEILKKILLNEKPIGLLGTVTKFNGKITYNPYRPFIEDLDTIPFPAREYVDIKKYPGYHYKMRGRDTSLLSSRGCPFNCTFCSNPVWKSNKPWYRLRSPKNVVDEMEEIIKVFGIREFYDQTDVLNVNNKWVEELCDEIIKRNLDINWKAQLRADDITDDLVKKLKLSHFWLAVLGIESANDKMLTGINKKINLEKITKTLSTFKKYNIKTQALLMAFNVWEEDGILHYEDYKDVLNTLNFAKRLLLKKQVDLISLSLTTPYPASKLYDIALKYNLIPKHFIGNWELWDGSSHMILKLPTVSKTLWLKIHFRAKLLQAFMLFHSKTYNFSSAWIYIKKVFYIVKSLTQLIQF